MNIPKKKYIIGIVILVILIITNPSLNAFRQYCGLTAYNNNYAVVRRTFNGFIFSIYTINGAGFSSKHLGMIGNFYELENTAVETPTKAGD